MSFENKTSIISSFLVCITFNSFSCPVEVAKTSVTILNGGDERGHPCLVPVLRKKYSVSHY